MKTVVKNERKIVAFIPVRGGSKSIPLKNIKLLNGRPLVEWALEAAVNSNLIDLVYVSTDSIKIRQTVEQYRKTLPIDLCNKVQCITRGSETATDTATTESAMLEFAKQYEFDDIILIQATSPFITDEDLTNGIRLYKDQRYDSLLSVVRQKRFIWETDDNNRAFPVNYDPVNRPRRQDFSGFLVENGAFYITTKENLIKTKSRLSGNIGFYEMGEESYFEIDEPSDWEIVENLLKKRSKKEVISRLNKIKLLATDCDGVLTDAGMYYSEDGDELKKFNTRDGVGFRLLKEFGIKTAIITGENIELVRRRAEKMKVDDVFLGVEDKVTVMESLLQKYGLSYDKVAYIGDDINDEKLLSRVGVSFSVNDAVDSIKDKVDFVTNANGGQGAVREVAEMILRNRV